jgi:gluconate 2-dehydrogenase gamma chain
MPDYLTRRAFLAATGTTLAAVWLDADIKDIHASLEHATAAAAGPTPAGLVLTPEQRADIEAIAAQIIPTDEDPGAREAHVVDFIDHSLATWAADQRGPLLAGLDSFNSAVTKQWPSRQRFAQLADAQQHEFLIANEKSPFFLQVRFATIAGMFSLRSYGGNHDKIGWRLLGFEDRFAWQPPFGAYDAESGK